MLHLQRTHRRPRCTTQKQYRICEGRSLTCTDARGLGEGGGRKQFIPKLLSCHLALRRHAWASKGPCQKKENGVKGTAEG